VLLRMHADCMSMQIVTRPFFSSLTNVCMHAQIKYHYIPTAHTEQFILQLSTAFFSDSYSFIIVVLCMYMYAITITPS